MKKQGSKCEVACDFCGKTVAKYPSKIKKHNFCSRECLAAFSSKSKNPEKYGDLKSYAGMSKNMKALNEKLNPTRMTVGTRLKLRNARLAKKSTGKSYEKLYGRHIHRTIAELALGRELKPGEVVHHIDGNIHNNDHKNLMVFESQALHAAWHAEHDAKKGSDAT